MNTTPSSPSVAPENPRLSCRVTRWWCSITDREPAAHVAACSACQAYFARVASLEGELRRPSRVGAGAGILPANRLEQEIIRAVRASDHTPASNASRPLKPRWMGAGVIATVLIAFGAVWSNRPTAGVTREEVANTAVTREDAAMIVAAVDAMATTLNDSVIPQAGELVVNNPLQTELGSVYSDARSALDFLALNFLPRATVAQAPAPRRGTG